MEDCGAVGSLQSKSWGVGIFSQTHLIRTTIEGDKLGLITLRVRFGYSNI